MVKRKQHHVVYGHKFVNLRLPVPAVCAVCREFLLTGYQCDSCFYLCHKRCHHKTLNKCIAESNAEEALSPDDMRRKISFNVPHRFEKTSVMTPSSCCHCGYVLPLARKNVWKCNICNSMCHEGCKQFIPNLCGLKPEMLELIFTPAPAPSNGSTPPKPAHHIAKSMDNLKIASVRIRLVFLY